MRILHGLDGLRALPQAAAITIGNYDGVHRGHATILRRARELALQDGHGHLAVVTFEPHPLTVLKPELAPPRLGSSARKEMLMCLEGVTHLVVLPPEPQVLNLSAEQFWGVLRDEVRPSWLIEGQSFNFGRGRGGTIEKLRQWTAGSAVRLDVVEGHEVCLLDLSLVTVSSSLIRWLLGHGRVRDAAICLGRPYELEGEVIRGHQRGRSIGVPTANLRIEDHLIPADAVYAGRCAVGHRAWPAAVSIGTMPTFGDHARQVEVHLIGFTGDLYNAHLRVELLDFVREQRKFANVEALKLQLHRDVMQIVARQEIDVRRAPALAAAGG